MSLGMQGRLSRNQLIVDGGLQLPSGPGGLGGRGGARIKVMTHQLKT